MATLTQQGSIDVFIPKGHHRFILGKGAETLKKIEAETGAKIQVPKINPDADAADEPINVMGSKEAMQAAKVRKLPFYFHKKIFCKIYNPKFSKNKYNFLTC